MKTSGLLFLILFFIPVLSFSGEIYGTIKGNDGKPLPNKIIQIKQNEMVLASDTTDTNGYFKITIKEVGKFKLEVAGHAGANIEVFSSNKATRCNLLLNNSGDKWILKNQ